MKNLILSVFFLINYCVLTAGASVVSIASYVVDAGGTVTISPQQLTDITVLKTETYTMLSDWDIELSSTPSAGTTWQVWIELEGLTGGQVTVFGNPMNDDQYNNKWGIYTFTVTDGGHILVNYSPRFYGWYYGFQPAINGQDIKDNSIPTTAIEGSITLSKMDSLGRGRVIVGASGNVMSSLNAAGNGKILLGNGTDLTSVSVTGDVSLSNTGVTILDSVITDADIKTGAAIKRQKIATGTGGYVLINNGAGYISEEAQLSTSRGGLGASVSGATGFVTFNAGSVSVGNLSDVRDLHVSFESDGQGTYYLTWPADVTVTSVEARVERTIAGTDTATILLQDNSGTAMAGSNLSTGKLVLAASATTGTGYTSTITSNNTFTTNQRMRLITSKATAGGNCNVQIFYTRNK